MTELASGGRSIPDARVKHLITWARAHKDRRVLIFTEYADTKRYLEKQLRAALTPGRDGDPSIATFHGGMSEDAREGVNLQNNCADLFHFDVPWNPSRLEQRNGRIDRKLQRSPEVRCHYFIYEQRPEDRVLKALVQKTKTIRRELGSLAPVVERRLEDRLTAGFARQDVNRFTEAIEGERVDPDREKAVQMELEAGRKRDRALKEQIGELQNLLKKSRDWLQIDKDDLRHAISCGLELLGAKPLQRKGGSDEYQLPDVVNRLQNEQSWLNTLDTLRPPRKRNQTLWDWRREAPIRPVVFSDPGSLEAKTVQLHLEHRFVQRLLGHFRSQGFVHHDLARACIGTTDDPIPRIILLGRLSLYGQRASRLHDEILAVAARWSDVDVRKEPLKPYAGSTLEKTLDLLDTMLKAETRKELSAEVRAFLGRGAVQDLG